MSHNVRKCTFWHVRPTKTPISLRIRASDQSLQWPHEEFLHPWLSKKRPVHITKTCLYNIDPLKPYFYILNWGLNGYKLFFLFLTKNIDCGYSLEPPRRGGSNEYPQSLFWAEIWKISEFLSENFQFLVVKFSVYLNRHAFVMAQCRFVLDWLIKIFAGRTCLKVRFMTLRLK